MDKRFQCDSVLVELEQAQILLSLIFEELDDAPKKISTKDDQFSAFVFCANRIAIIDALSRSIFSILECQREVLNRLVDEEGDFDAAKS